MAYAVGCVEEEGTDALSVLVGVAYEATAEVPLPGARILARWTEHEAGPVMVAVFVDGVRIAAPQYFLYNLQVTEFESIEYVSPLPGAIRYGLDAGHQGVLLLWTRGRGPHVHPDRDEQRR